MCCDRIVTGHRLCLPGCDGGEACGGPGPCAQLPSVVSGSDRWARTVPNSCSIYSDL